MEENKDIMEQPQQLSAAQDATAQEKEGGAVVESEKGSILGKFKDPESLEKAYENLQKEFTKKCQQLSSSQKDLESLKNKREDNSLEFLENNPEAKDHIDVLKNMIASDKLLQNTVSPLNAAWNKFRQDNYVSQSTLANNEEFLERYIYNNENVKQKVLNDYFKGLDRETVPPMIAKQIGSKSILTKNTKPSSFVEAGKIVKSILEKQ